jgi:hypothetical protein
MQPAAPAALVVAAVQAITTPEALAAFLRAAGPPLAAVQTGGLVVLEAAVGALRKLVLAAMVDKVASSSNGSFHKGQI